MAKKSTLVNAGFIRRILKEEGFSDIAASAALARMRQESSLNPNARRKNDAGPGKDSVGIFQWNRERLAGLERFAQKQGTTKYDLETQVRYFANEAKTTESEYGSKLLSAKTPYQAAVAAISMARPLGWTKKNPTAGHGWNNTVNWTEDWGMKQHGESTVNYGTDPENLNSDHMGQQVKQTHRPPSTVQADFTLPQWDPNAQIQENLEPIDNSPGAKLTQTITGMLVALGAGAKSQEEAAGDAPDDSASNMKNLTSGSSGQSPSAHSILAMIKGMGR